MKLSRQDVNYALVHTVAFLIAYTGAMVSTPVKWCSWDALNKGLIGSGIANIGINLASKSNTIEVKGNAGEKHE